MNLPKLSFIVVEDDDFQRRLIVRMLHSLGAKSVDNARDGKEALDIINRCPADIVICDLNMPEMDGVEFLRRLGERQGSVSVIIISALGDKLLGAAARIAKAHGIRLLGTVEKPLVQGHLKELVSKYSFSDGKWQKSSPSGPSFALEDIQEGVRNGEFEPYFQPKVDFKTGRIVGAEALARWIHPQLGMVSPVAFIPPLEQSNNIDDLTLLILEKSATACRFFHEAGYPLAISVNLSLVSLDDTSLADKITRIVQKAEVDPRHIILEITETAIMGNLSHALENLTRLCINGFSLSIDDYGTGYSSMQQLTRIPFSELKIDQSFVRDFVENKALRIVIESSVDMAHKLQIKSTAEGVETQQAWDALKGIGCDTAQGFFISKPMDIKAFHSFLTDYSAFSS